MAFRLPRLDLLLDRIGDTNAQGEFYLTDAVEIARADGLKAAVVECDEDEVLGVNARDQLATAEAIRLGLQVSVSAGHTGYRLTIDGFVPSPRRGERVGVRSRRATPL